MSQDPPDGWHYPPEAPIAAFDGVQVWRVELNQPPSVVLTLRQSLAANELARAKRFVLDRDRRRFIVGRSALRHILALYLNVPPASIRFAYSDRGKPRLAEACQHPVSGSELCFNLSHSAELALVAVTMGRQVGVDVERLDPTVNRELLTRGSFTPQEQGRLAALPEAQQLRAFFQTWTRKEAFLKACGRGLSLPLDQLEVTQLHGEPTVLVRGGDDGAENTRWAIIDVRVDGDNAAAVVVEGENSRLHCWEWSPRHAS